MLHEWAQDDPRQAAEWALAHAPPGPGADAKNSGLAWVFYAWRDGDRASAEEWWSHLPDSPARDQLGVTVAASFAADGKYEEAFRAYQPKPGAEAAEQAASIAQAGAPHDPARMAAWLDSLPPGIDTTKAATAVLGEWVGRDAVAAANWAEAQPEGPRREAALQAYAHAAAERDPAAAAEWAAAITDPRARATAAEFVFDQMKRRDATAARAWLGGLAGVDEAWRDRILRLK